MLKDQTVGKTLQKGVREHKCTQRRAQGTCTFIPLKVGVISDVQKEQENG